MQENSTVTFNVGYLKESAVSLAESHSVIMPGKIIKPIQPEVETSKEILTEAYRTLSALAKSDQELSPAAEWLIDNFYIIQEQLVQIVIDFPKEFQKSIPVLQGGELDGLPRVYELILNYLTHTDNVVDDNSLMHYIQSYQQAETLQQGEVWALPIMLRLILIRKLAEKASRILERKKIWKEVKNLVESINREDAGEPGALLNMITDWARSDRFDQQDPLALVELYNRLQVSGYLLEEQKRWFTYRFKQMDLTMEDAMRIEAQKQSRLQVSIQNAVVSLRWVSETDWSDFVEECSMVHQILMLDPLRTFGDMDFQTRDSYRRAVERLSRRSDLTETEVAEQVLLLAESNTQAEEPGESAPARQHVGYYLQGEGYRELVRNTGYRMPLRERINRLLERVPGIYIGAIILHTIILMVILWLFTGAIGNSPAVTTAILLISLFPALDLSVSAINRFFAFFLPPRILPKMSDKTAIPDRSRTLVVVPSMFTTPADVRRQIENLEIRSLANPDPGLQFVLLTDFTDAPQKKMPEDRDILKMANSEIDRLNHKYSSRYGDKFFVLHRERLWNEKEGVWIGWERKRGKLEEFNRLICNREAKTGYTFMAGRFLETLEAGPVRYVITLDADTKLPPDSAKDLVRTISHPLNRAVYDSALKRIISGYAIIQPRISIPPESARKTRFSRIFSGNVGLDPYTTAVSDVYQDLTGEAVFTGKGIYDVEAFHQVLEERFPENRILSHDLIESTYLRTGLATDIELFDDYPSTYVSYSKRNHRWTRGDWQIAAWLFRKVPASDGKERNPINRLSRWKIFDNLRRSLNPFFLTLFFIAGWFVLPGSGWIWTLAAFGILAFPIYVSLSSDILNRPARVRWMLYMDKIRSNLKINSWQALFTVISLPHQAWIHLDAIFRTLYRLKVSGKRLLEWTTASQTEKMSPNGPASYVQMMWVPVLLGTALFFYSLVWTPHYLWMTVPFALLWAGSPVWLWIISQPVKDVKKPLSEEDESVLRLYARRTWFYFERFVNEEHFWLPPDNYQIDPALPPTERTSPTNIGLALASAQSAYNLGYITLGELFERQLRTLRSVEKLERYRGHLYNWYETRLGEALSPRYVSTVDSGNFAAGLIVVKESARQLLSQKGVNKNLKDGLRDTILTMQHVFKEYKNHEMMPKEGYKRIVTFTRSMLENLRRENGKSRLITLELLKSLKEDAAALSAVDLLPLGSRLDDQEMRDLLFWLESPLRQVENAIEEYRCMDPTGSLQAGLYSPDELKKLVEGDPSAGACNRLLNRWEEQVAEITTICERLLDEIDFSFLYLEKRGLFSIGYNVDKARLDPGTYDLLASEARIASYIAIAKGDVPAEHWFRLSRRLTSIEQNEILLSWGGTMFEYLMPLLFLKSYPDTLIDHTYKNVIRWQKEYGRKKNLPWGYSESAYAYLNIDLHYQYRAFGAPGLGLKRGLAEENVVAPYASLLALMVEPADALENLREIEKYDGFGLHGFFDAIDFTPSRLTENESHKVVKTFMVHHHGMSLLAIDNVLNDNSVQRWFHSDPAVKGCELMLQERVPRGVPIKEPHPIDVELEPGEQKSIENVVEHEGIESIDSSPPRVHMLANGSFSTLITHAGTGRAKYHDIVLNGWNPDPVEDPLGLFFYIKDRETDTYWSAMHQPVKRKPDRYDTWFHIGKIVNSRVDEWIETTTEITVATDHPIELRKITLTNYSERVRQLQVTSYAEVVLNREESHAAHPAFSKLFVQTDYLAEHHSIIAKRRPRSDEEPPVYLVHTFAGQETDNLTDPLQFETERSRFIGRGRDLATPAAMDPDSRLSGSMGNVSDPIVSLRKNVMLKPGEKVELTFGIGYAGSEEEARQMADTYDNHHAVQRAFDLSSIYSLVELNHLGMTPMQAHYYQKLAAFVAYSDNRYRADKKQLIENRKQQQDLWSYGISGDMPLVIYRVSHINELKHVKTLLKAHSFWKIRGLESELLILNDHAPSYADEIQEAIVGAVESSTERETFDRRGGVFVQRSDRIPADDLTLLLTAAHAVWEKTLPGFAPRLTAANEYVSWQSGIRDKPDSWHPAVPGPATAQDDPEAGKDLHFYNGYGGFTETGREYQILISADPVSGRHRYPPAPWSNVIANQKAGFLVTERGAGYTWSDNSRENKLTGWSNDPVSDPHSELFYIRDEKRMIYWTPTPGPVPGENTHLVTHGFGYSRFETTTAEIRSELTQFMADEEPVKISILTLKNESSKKRTLSLFRYEERVMGVLRNKSSRYVVPELSDDGRTLMTRNHYNNEFAGRPAFLCLLSPDGETGFAMTTGRKHFIGRNRSVRNPAAVTRLKALNNEVGPGVDSCAAFQSELELMPGETTALVVLTGEASDDQEMRQILEKYDTLEAAQAELEHVTEEWQKRVTRVTVDTPDPALNLMVNGWLTYQNLSSRMYARTAFYQAGGAYGFRDQLQDSMAALYTDPAITRRQILLHAERQFPEGDVLHWWHPPTGRGIRSEITDDRLWLPYVTDFYLKSTGDESILDETIPYIESRKLDEGEHEAYLIPVRSDQSGTLYEHCCKAIDITLRMGRNGLPLMGGGDWNDGMNRVGEHGEGESVWLGFFLYTILKPFARICEKRGDAEKAGHYKSAAGELKQRLNREGWDGEWYLRAYYDDGTPLGSTKNSECRIDAISQAWSVISGVASEKRSEQVLKAVEAHLVDSHTGIIKLLTPPFNKTEKNPGYIKGYIPGVRENGGQYTHAALWVIKAFAERGMGNRAAELFRMINPVDHGSTAEKVHRYKAEPYVVAADVYGEPPLTGMGGWTWYTGSGGWMYRVALESMLGFSLRNGQILLNPSIPSEWSRFAITFRPDDNGTRYLIEVLNPDGISAGTPVPEKKDSRVTTESGKTVIKVDRDGAEHHIRLVLREKKRRPTEPVGDEGHRNP
jgi:cyclic beta-1,2-glucan synthetase